MVVGIGGGSVLDVAKLLSVLLHPEAPSLDGPAGGRAAATTNLLIVNPGHRGHRIRSDAERHSGDPRAADEGGIISPVLLPDYVALLPELTTSMPPSIAVDRIDALCHLLECFTSTVANPVSDNAALIGLHKLVRHIERSVNQPQDLTAKLEMLWASWYGGAAINYAGTHLVHALSYPLGGTWHLPHGVANAILLAPCMRVVRPHAVAKFAQVWDLIPDADRTLSAEEKSHALVVWLAALVKRLPLPDNLAALGVPQESISALSAAAQNVKRLMNNAPCSVAKRSRPSTKRCIQNMPNRRKLNEESY
jgi:alcohol dehydrogenase class IV